MRLERIFENPRVMGFLKKLMYITMVILVLLDFVIPRHHIAFFWDRIPGFNAVYGFVSCILIIVVSKALGKWWLQKDEDYYER